MQNFKSSLMAIFSCVKGKNNNNLGGHSVCILSNKNKGQTFEMQRLVIKPRNLYLCIKMNSQILRVLKRFKCRA